MDRNVDKKGRWRSVTVAFRVSPEENEDLNTRVRLSGLTKQDYIIRRLQEREAVSYTHLTYFQLYAERFGAYAGQRLYN